MNVLIKNEDAKIKSHMYVSNIHTNNHSDIIDFDESNLILINQIPINKPAIRKDGNQRIGNMMQNKTAMSVARSEQIISLAKDALQAEDLYLWNIDYLIKPPGRSKRLGWHCDSHFWNGMIFEEEADWNTASIWMPLCDITEANGGLRYLSGDIVGDFKSAEFHDLYKDKIHATIGMSKGQLLMFNQDCAHSSLPNESDSYRQALIFRITSTPDAIINDVVSKRAVKIT